MIIIYDKDGQPVGAFYLKNATLLEKHEPMPGGYPYTWERLYALAPGPQYFAVDIEMTYGPGPGGELYRPRARRLTTLEAIAWCLERGKELPEELRQAALSFTAPARPMLAAPAVTPRPALPAPDGPVAVPAATLMSAADLAVQVGLPRGNPGVETFLRRYRSKNPACVSVVDSPRKNESRFLYQVAAVLPALREWLAGQG
jgi:hypothetical protein